MTTPAAARSGPAGSRRTRVPLVLLAVGAVLAAGAVSSRDGASAPTTSDLARIEQATRQGCAAPARDLTERTAFAMDGVVLESTPVPGDRGARVRLEVREWFRGPPLDRVEVTVPAETVRWLRVRERTRLVPGTRLLVSGDGWGGGRSVLDAAGCGRTLLRDPPTAADWRTALASPGPPSPDGPLARYPAAGFVRGGPTDPPALTGVLLLDRGCLYVDDGLTRWVPVLPDDARWLADPPQLSWAGQRVEVGHQVRLPGSPATGVVQRAARPLRAEESEAHQVDEAGVPTGCDRVRPRFVVSQPLLGDVPAVRPMLDRDPLPSATRQAATTAGLDPVAVSGETRVDLFGAQQARLLLETRAVGDVLVHVETVAVLAWPRAYAPSDARFRWSVDPGQADSLPHPPPGAQLVVVDRADGTTQLLLRTGGRVVVSVTVDLPGSAPADEDELRLLTDLAVAVSLSGAGVGS